jgi:hypothetical protein
VSLRSTPIESATRGTTGNASRRSGDSLQFPGADMNGAITLQVRSQNATTLSPRRFLWASMALFDDDAARDTASVYRPLHLELHAVTEVRARILRILAHMSDGAPLEHMRPELQAIADNEPGRALWRRSAWSSTFLGNQNGFHDWSPFEPGLRFDRRTIAGPPPALLLISTCDRTSRNQGAPGDVAKRCSGHAASWLCSISLRIAAQPAQGGPLKAERSKVAA